MSKRRINLAGMIQGDLIVQNEQKKIDGFLRWKCLCKCGGVVWLKNCEIRNGNVSCGCRRKNKAGSSDNPLYITWASLRQKCYNQFHSGYENYGEAGITVCKRWNVFSNFVDDVSPRPPRHYLRLKKGFTEFGPDSFVWVPKQTAGVYSEKI